MLKGKLRHLVNAGFKRVIVGIIADDLFCGFDDDLLDKAGNVVIVIVDRVSVEATALGNVTDADLVYRLFVQQR